jgi:hypothetical protein
MEKDVEKIVIEFNNIAARLYSAAFSQFSDSVQKINRRKDENVFKLQLAKYSDMLKNRLEEQVKKIVEENRSIHDYDQLRVSLSSQLNYYLQEFRKRSNSL